jgi:adenosylcobyric acid synthase
MSARALMILGTASHVGKSLVTAGLGRIFSDEGIRVAPFKAQNMSLNSASTPDGREIGRAQALQAEACRATPCAEMNPVLIKPSSDTGAQIVLLGKVWGQVSASDYHRKRVEDLFPAVLESYGTLAARYDLILLEGAGSPAEINLREHDIVNMRMAHAADAACLLVGDIDRGGVFASLLGTMELLDAADRARIRAFVINKFRGDMELLRPGVEMMERRLGIPCAGVVPFLHQLGLEEEDSVAIEDRRTAARVWRDTGERRLRIGVVALPYMANFTDFDALGAEPSVSLAFLEQPEEAQLADVVILPGSKQTLDDLTWLRERGFAQAVVSHRGMRIGICGGFQMLGLSIEDPAGVESAGCARNMNGLGLLPVRTILRGQKTVRRVTGQTSLWDAPPFTGYEIHMGETDSDGPITGSGKVWGTYIHGVFDDDAFRHSFLRYAHQACGLAPPKSYACVTAQREARIDRWANHLRQSLDMNLIRHAIT